ncbi:MAG: hypothetical protein JO345_22210 [Streptosporangiaceae bacterium]|nr:hypothetical protein [Streptosporangiaceae bacterium]
MPLAEGEVGEFVNKGGVSYTAVTSCLTVTCKIAGVPDTYVGGHLSLQVPSDKLDSSKVLPEMKKLINGRTIERLHLAGVLDGWSDKYLTKPLFTGTGADAQLNYDDLPNATHADSLASIVLLDHLINWDGESALPKMTFETKKDQFTISF